MKIALDIETRISDSVFIGEVEEVESPTNEALKQGLDATTILHKAYILGLDIVGGSG